jgi:type I restriction enzyme S subunit
MPNKLLPEGWRELELGSVARYINGRAFKPKEWGKKGLPIIRIQNLNDPKKDFNYFDGEYAQEHYVNSGAILISWSASLGVYVWDGGPALVNQHIFKVLLDESLIDKRYFVYVVQNILEEMKSRVHGSTMKHIVKKDFLSLRIPTPPLHVQRGIADILDIGKRLQSIRGEATQLTDKVLHSVFLKMFGDLFTNSHGWEMRRLEDVCDRITDGTHRTPKYVSDGVPFLSVKNITSGYIDFSDTKFITKEEHAEITRRCKPEKGDILYTKVGTIGIASVVDTDKEFSIFVSIALLKPKRDLLDPVYLKWMLNSPFVKSQANRRVKGIGVPDLHLVEIKDFKVAVPPLSEQVAFARFVAKVDALRQRQLLSTQEINGLFKSLMHKAFSGQLRA